VTNGSALKACLAAAISCFPPLGPVRFLRLRFLRRAGQTRRNNKRFSRKRQKSRGVSPQTRSLTRFAEEGEGEGEGERIDTSGNAI